MSEIPKTADFVILGAGVMGASIAFHLAQRKAGSIVVLEKNHVGSGGSSRSSALVRMHYSFPPEVQLALSSLLYFENWQEIVGEPTHFKKTGFVRLVLPRENELLKRNVEMQRSLGVNVRLISRDELHSLEPNWVVDDVEIAAYEPDSGYADGAATAGDFLARARDLGVTYVAKTQATEFVVNGGNVSGVQTEAGVVSAPVVIAATGPWTRPLFQRVGFDPPIETEYHQVAVMRSAAHPQRIGAACIDSITESYFRSDGPDKYLVGDFYGERNVDPDNFPQSASATQMEEVIERACRRLPRLAQAEVMKGVTGIYDMTPDSRPLMGGIPGVRGLYMCAGFSGMGFKISPAVGLAFADLLLDSKSKSVDISAFAPDRFTRNQPIRAEFEYQDDSYQ